MLLRMWRKQSAYALLVGMHTGATTMKKYCVSFSRNWGWCTGMIQRDDMGWEGRSGLGTHVHLRLIHVNAWQNQYSIAKQNKVKIKIKKKRNLEKNCYVMHYPTSGYVVKGNEIIVSKRDLYSHVHCSIIHSSLGIGTA